ncbi:MAG: methyl-accepting chemotaxis protein [Sphingomonadaceae bacterium]
MNALLSFGGLLYTVVVAVLAVLAWNASASLRQRGRGWLARGAEPAAAGAPPEALAADEMRQVAPYLALVNRQLAGSLQDTEQGMLGLIEAVMAIHSMSDQQMGRITAAEQNGAELSSIVHEKILVDQQMTRILEMFVLRQEQDVAANLTRIQRLQEVKSLGPLVDVIASVAQQTNFLSINAAVLAAHAGEGGRAFAVLAAEIRQLSHKTAEAAKDIGVKISKATDGIDAELSGVNKVGDRQLAIGNMRKVVDDIKEMQDRFSTASERLLEIVDGDKQAHQQLVGRISDALGHVQNHDIMRQRIEHVQSALMELQEHLEGVADQVQGNRWNPEAMRSLRQRLDEQMERYVMHSQRAAHSEATGSATPAPAAERPMIELF